MAAFEGRTRDDTSRAFAVQASKGRIDSPDVHIIEGRFGVNEAISDCTTSEAGTIVCFAGSVLANKGIGTVSRFSKLESAMTY